MRTIHLPASPATDPYKFHPEKCCFFQPFGPNTDFFASSRRGSQSNLDVLPGVLRCPESFQIYQKSVSVDNIY